MNFAATRSVFDKIQDGSKTMPPPKRSAHAAPAEPSFGRKSADNSVQEACKQEPHVLLAEVLRQAKGREFRVQANTIAITGTCIGNHPRDELFHADDRRQQQAETCGYDGEGLLSADKAATELADSFVQEACKQEPRVLLADVPNWKKDQQAKGRDFRVQLKSLVDTTTCIGNRPRDELANADERRQQQAEKAAYDGEGLVKADKAAANVKLGESLRKDARFCKIMADEKAAREAAKEAHEAALLDRTGGHCAVHVRERPSVRRFSTGEELLERMRARRESGVGLYVADAAWERGACEYQRHAGSDTQALNKGHDKLVAARQAQEARMPKMVMPPAGFKLSGGSRLRASDTELLRVHSLEWMN